MNQVPVIRLGLAALSLLVIGLSVVASHEVGHCVSGWAHGAREDCSVTFYHPADWVGESVLATASLGFHADHWAIYPLQLGFFALVVWIHGEWLIRIRPTTHTRRRTTA